MTDKHTSRHERKPKPVKLSVAPWERAQDGKSGASAPTAPATQEGRGWASPRDLATTPATRYHQRKE